MYGGAYIRKDFWLKGDLCMPKNSAFGVQSERLITIFSAYYLVRQNFKIEQK